MTLRLIPRVTSSNLLSRMRTENTIPVLGVEDLEESRRFYVDVLGFREDWGFDPGSPLGSVGREGNSIMLCTGESKGMTVWIGVEDIVPFHEACIAAGARIVLPPQNMPWAFEFRALDPSGNILWFGSGPLPETGEVV